MHHGGRSLQREAHDLVRGRAAEIGDKADAARIVLFEIDRGREGRRLDGFGRDGTDLARRARKVTAHTGDWLTLYFKA